MAVVWACNKLGDLVLLPKDFNASYGDMPYDEKVENYFGQNALARSVRFTPRHTRTTPASCGSAPNANWLLLPMRRGLRRADINARQGLYRGIAEIVWDPARVGLG